MKRSRSEPKKIGNLFLHDEIVPLSETRRMLERLDTSDAADHVVAARNELAQATSFVTAENNVDVFVQAFDLPEHTHAPSMNGSSVPHRGLRLFFGEERNASLLMFRLPNWLLALVALADLMSIVYKHTVGAGWTQPRDSVQWNFEDVVSGYSYSNSKHPANNVPCPGWMMALLSFFRCLGFPVNMFFGNIYRNMRNGIGGHADDESQFSSVSDICRSVVGIVFGTAARAIRFSPHGKSTKMVDVVVPHGWCYVMEGDFQNHFFHSIVQSTPKVVQKKMKELLKERGAAALNLVHPSQLDLNLDNELELCNWLSDCVGYTMDNPVVRMQTLRRVFSRFELSEKELKSLHKFFVFRASITGRCFIN